MKKRVSKSAGKFKCDMKDRGPESAVYGLGFLGALVYYITTATSLSAAIIGFLKALIWPAFLVFEVMKFLGM